MNTDKFATYELSRFQDLLGDDWDWMPADSEDLRASYSSINRGLIDDLNLVNPRTFIKFVDHLRELWPRYIDKIITEEESDIFRLHAAFLILLIYIWHPTECDYKMFQNLKGQERPRFIIRVRDHFNHLFPKYQSNNAELSYTLKHFDSIVHEATHYLNQFPDYQRSLRLKQQE
ncbi:hypothetical protein [Mesobacillus subterraneus]|uniref:hypothetical protein n=1 Tax=Mesobacillus subterraneus TaxID=285983 RepID=UPI001CFC69B5|nr:hypothetical protein [Mesobacillus subterraneus]